jgi:hypothetical protein
MKSMLSIDGGGIRGIIPLACLVRLESESGKPAREIFDMMAGTSTGAIIVAGLATGMSARGLLSLYKNLAEKAFRLIPLWKIALNLGNHRYSSEFIAKTLDELGTDIPINDLPIDIMITAKNTRSGQTDFFVKDNPGNASLWGTLHLNQAVLASIAAPTYFPAHLATIKGKQFSWVDGGVGVAGNPCYQAVVEALHYSDGKYHPAETRLLSFGTGRSPHPIDAQQAHVLDWASWVLRELLDDTSEWQSFVVRKEYEQQGKVDFRRYQLDLTPDVMDFLGVELPEGREVSKISLDSVWAVDLLDRIGRAFAAQIDFSHPDGYELKSGEAF